MKKVLLVCLLSIAALIATSCKKDETPAPEPTPSEPVSVVENLNIRFYTTADFIKYMDYEFYVRYEGTEEFVKLENVSTTPHVLDTVSDKVACQYAAGLGIDKVRYFSMPISIKSGKHTFYVKLIKNNVPIEEEKVDSFKGLVAYKDGKYYNQGSSFIATKGIKSNQIETWLEKYNSNDIMRLNDLIVFYQ